MMSIAFESNTADRIHRLHGMSSYLGIYDSTGDQRFSSGSSNKSAAAAAAAAKVKEDEEDTCSSSSIGRNSDSGDSDDGDSGDGDEVQSSFQEGPLNNLNALEEVLPIKRGISTFYCGKSKSFASIADAASCPSIKDIAKPEDAYTRKRKNLLAHSMLSDKNHNLSSRSNSGGISKRPASSSRSTLVLGLSMNNYGGSYNHEVSISNSSSPRLSLPPLPPQGRRPANNESLISPPRRNLSPWRSFSLSDLQHASDPTITGSGINDKDKEKK